MSVFKVSADVAFLVQSVSQQREERSSCAGERRGASAEKAAYEPLLSGSIVSFYPIILIIKMHL